jgi:hypothetical protein
MLGHDTGIAGSSYYRPTDQELLADFLKAIDALTINEENKLRRKLQEATEKMPDAREMEERHNRDMDNLRQEMEIKFRKVMEKIDFNRLH